MALREQIKELATRKADAELRASVADKDKRDILVSGRRRWRETEWLQLRLTRADDEKASYEESRKWFLAELTDRDNRINEIRLEFVSAVKEGRLADLVVAGEQGGRVAERAHATRQREDQGRGCRAGVCVEGTGGHSPAGHGRRVGGPRARTCTS